MRKVKFIVVHCTASQAQQRTSDILSYWKNKLGWSSVGYHKLISGNGEIETLSDDEKPTNGVKGYNAVSVHVCYKGGWNGQDTRTIEQKTALLKVLKEYRKKYPDAQIVGHRDLSPDLNGDGKITPNEFVKKCPCFDAMEEYKFLQP
jgi:N-acetyl-anhydromuramyl-L-alanine amidase AmpD